MCTVHIREARQDDAFGMARVRVDTWKATYPGIMPEELLQNMTYQQTVEAWQSNLWPNRDPKIGLFVAETEKDEIVGIAFCGPERGQDSLHKGEIYVLYVLPAYQGQGIGRKLVAACVEYLLREIKATNLLIWVAAENPNRRFYDALGGKVIREQTRKFSGTLVPEVAYGWETLQPLR